mgnify:CR=1 FL=1
MFVSLYLLRWIFCALFRAGKGVIILLSIHKTINGKMTRLDAVQDGCWVNLTYPARMN